jgi:protein TonB
MAKRQFLVLLGFLGVLVSARAQTDTVAKPKKLRISSGVAAGLKMHDVAPKYPKEAREKGIQGDVLLQAMIDTKGNIASLQAVQGDPILVEASIEAVKQWRYKPYVLNGEPVEVETTIKIQFHL